MLEAGQTFRLDLDETPGTNERVMLPHPEIIKASEVGHVLLIDDGKMKLEVIGKGEGYLDCKVVIAGRIKDRKVYIQCVVSYHMMWQMFIAFSHIPFDAYILSILCRELTHLIPSWISRVLHQRTGRISSSCSALALIG